MTKLAFLSSALVAIALAADPPAQRFGLRIPDLTNHLFSGGGVVILPAGKSVKTLEFVLGPPGAKYLGPGRIAVSIDGKRLENIEVASEGPNLVVTAITSADAGFVPAGARVKIEVYEMRNGDYRQTWLLRYGKTTFLRETVGEADGVPVEFALETPDHAVVLFPGDATTSVTLKGSVNLGANLASLTANGAPVDFRSSQSESTFQKTIDVDRNAGQIELTAKDKEGNSCTVVIPVLSRGSNKK